HGVQLNYADGPWSVSVAGTDGFFSGELTWFTGAVTYKLDDNNTFGINGGVNLGRQNVFARSPRYQFATLPLQQKSGILSVNYTYANGPWTITPYFQFTNVEPDPGIGIPVGASTYGGAVLAAYSFSDNFSLGGRVEYITQSGRPGGTAPSLLYGPGSS
ncbi:outer membrane beta-barrel protein, partial [Escherichia coli]|uniref:outer membrane beta-barrel protein n=1 Tax=Escherichia coli TaxID=562 RepID=UPI0015948AF9